MALNSGPIDHRESKTDATTVRYAATTTSRLSFAEVFGNRKLESLGYRVALFA